jgi:heme A synthase
MFLKRRPLVTGLAFASLAAIAAEGAVGGVVVVHELAPWLVLVHLGLAMVILGLLIATAVMSLPESAGVGGGRFRGLAALAAGATYVLLLTGSTVVASGADESCHTWPLCGAGLSPDFAGVNAFTMVHRGAVLLIGVLIVYVLVSALREPSLLLIAAGTLTVFAVQLAVGAGAALTNWALFNGLHVAIATLVWSGMLSIALMTLPRADRVSSLSHLSAEKRPA